jgi:hypothetical protein
MANQQLSRADPAGELSIACQVMDDAVTFYLANGGPAVAREHVEKLAKNLIFYDDSSEAYRNAIARICQAEKEEQQRMDERNRQQQRSLMLSLMGVIQSDLKPHKSSDTTPCARQEPVADTLPPKLASEKARRMWEILMREGLIDDCYQPVGLSRTEVALLAEEMTIRLADENDNLLDIKEWKPYETIWHRSNMKADHQRARGQEKTPEFRDRLKRLFADI